MKTKQMEDVLERLSMATFGRSRSLAIAGEGCVKCGESASSFRDEVSKREFKISGLCQKCQDEVFGE